MAKTKIKLRWLCKKTCSFYKPRENSICGAIQVLDKLISKKVLKLSQIREIIK